MPQNENLYQQLQDDIIEGELKLEKSATRAESAKIGAWLEFLYEIRDNIKESKLQIEFFIEELNRERDFYDPLWPNAIAAMDFIQAAEERITLEEKLIKRNLDEYQKAKDNATD